MASVTLAARRAALRRSSEGFRRVLRPSGSGESDRPSIAATGAQFAHPLAVFDTRGRAQARKLRPEFGQRLGTMLALAFGLARIEAHHVASAAFSVADDFGGLASGRMQGALCRAMTWTLALPSMTLIRSAAWLRVPAYAPLSAPAMPVRRSIRLRSLLTDRDAHAQRSEERCDLCLRGAAARSSIPTPFPDSGAQAVPVPTAGVPCRRVE